MSKAHTSRNDLERLYCRAFDEFGAAALWNSAKISDPSPADALAVARALRRKGDLSARRLAEEIEAACHALN